MSTTTSQAAYESLRERILEGSIPPESTLRQDALAQDLGISRTPLRTALTELARDGLVSYEANRGYTVRAFDDHDIRTAFAVRAVLEGLACRLVAERGAAQGMLDTLRDCVRTGDKILAKGHLDPDELAPYRRMNVRFHDTIIAASANQWVTDFVARTHNVPLASDRVILWEEYAIIKRSHDDHHRILHALAQGDARRAENLMWEHVTYAGEVLIEHVRQLSASDRQPVTQKR